MLRLLVAVLVFANLGFFSWTRGWLTPIIGIDPAGDHEPQRLKAQVRAQTIRVLGPAQATPAAAAPPASASALPTSDSAVAAVVAAASVPALAPADAGLVCLEAGPFAVAEVSRLEAVLREALPPGTWNLQAREGTIGGPWMAYVGRFTDLDALRLRTEELRRQNVRYDEVRGLPELEPGLSLGRFETEEAAREELRKLAQRGLRGGRVVTAPALPPTYRLRIEQADGVLMALALRLKDRLMGRPLALCQQG